MNKRDTIAAIGHKTRMRNHDVQNVLETLLEIWTEALAQGERIEIQNFVVLEVQTITRQGNTGQLVSNGKPVNAPASRRQLRVKPSKYLRARLRRK